MQFLCTEGSKWSLWEGLHIGQREWMFYVGVPQPGATLSLTRQPPFTTVDPWACGSAEGFRAVVMVVSSGSGVWWPDIIYGGQTSSMVSRHLWWPDIIYGEQTSSMVSRHLWWPDIIYGEQTSVVARHLGKQTSSLVSRLLWWPDILVSRHHLW